MNDLYYSWAILYYLWSIASTVSVFAKLAFVFGIISFIMSWIFIVVLNVGTNNKNVYFIQLSNKFVKWSIYTIVVSVITISVVPSYRDLKMMVALTGIETAVKSEKARSLVSKSVKVIENAIDELSKKEKKNGG